LGLIDSRAAGEKSSFADMRVGNVSAIHCTVSVTRDVRLTTPWVLALRGTRDVGLRVFSAERADKTVGSVVTRELTGSGLEQDFRAVSRAPILGNLLMRNAEAVGAVQGKLGDYTA
jgi:hypothetical protein